MSRRSCVALQGLTPCMYMYLLSLQLYVISQFLQDSLTPHYSKTTVNNILSIFFFFFTNCTSATFKIIIAQIAKLLLPSCTFNVVHKIMKKLMSSTVSCKISQFMLLYNFCIFFNALCHRH